MADGFYNTHSVSDSEDDCVIVDEDHRPKNASPAGNDLPSSPEEPEFFRSVLQHKRKKSSSPETSVLGEDYGRFGRQHINGNANKQDDDCVVVGLVPKRDKPSVEMIRNNWLDPDGHSVMNNKQSNEMVEPKRKKRFTKEEIEQRKKEEKSRKDAKKKLTEELKRLNPKECLKYMTVHIDTNIQNCDYSQDIITQIQSSDAKYTIESNLSSPNSVTWSRQMSDTLSEEENCMVIIWDFEHVQNLIMSKQLIEQINNLKLYKVQLSLIIYSTADQLKKAKSKKKNPVSWSDMLNSLEEMMLICHVSFRFIQNKSDIGLVVFNFTKSIAQKPHKLNKYKEEQEGCDWYASGHTKNCVTIDKNGNGTTQLWRQMLSQFPLCALETSEAIASIYSSPVILLEAYDKCSSKSEGEMLLQDIPVRRGFGPLASNRRIGPELSKKIFLFFTDNNGYTTLSQEQ